MNYIIAFIAGFAACFAIGFYRRRKENPTETIRSTMAHTMGTAWRPPK